jgi:hypothetical protein
VDAARETVEFAEPTPAAADAPAVPSAAFVLFRREDFVQLLVELDFEDAVGVHPVELASVASLLLRCDDLVELVEVD